MPADKKTKPEDDGAPKQPRPIEASLCHGCEFSRMVVMIERNYEAESRAEEGEDWKEGEAQPKKVLDATVFCHAPGFQLGRPMRGGNSEWDKTHRPYMVSLPVARCDEYEEKRADQTEGG